MDLLIYEVDEISFEDNYMKDIEISIKFDVVCFINFGGYIGELKIGLKYWSWEKDCNSSIVIFDGEFDDLDVL